MEPRNRFQGMNSVSLCSLAGRYDNPIPTRFLAPIDCLKIPSLVIQCVDRKLKAADQLIYAEDDDILHVAFIATNVNRSEHYLKGQCHDIFDFRFPTRISFPQAPDYSIRAVSKLIHEQKKPKQKVSWHCPFKSSIYSIPNRLKPSTIVCFWLFFIFTALFYTVQYINSQTLLCVNFLRLQLKFLDSWPISFR